MILLKGLDEDGYVYDFSVDYDAMAVGDILDIHTYLMKKIVHHKMFGFFKKMFVVPMSFFSYNSLKYGIKNDKC